MKHSIKTFFIISLCLLFILTPILARAQFVEAITGVSILSKIMEMSGGNQDIFNVGSAILGFFTIAISTIAQGVLNVSYYLLSWVISPDFMGPVIQDNPIVQSGWGTVRNLANVALVFGLVAIAISIIVGFQETKAKKALINFIGVALLINFTPVLCGVIIDFANKLMSLFLTSGISYDVTETVIEGLTSGSFSFDNPVIPVAYLLFAIFSSIIYFLYAFIFIARHIVLWVLVIVSPIAFASKVFPEGKYIAKIFPSITYWDEWWNQFLQWTVIGIPAAFSLYLSEKIMFSGSLVSTPPGQLGGLGDLFILIIPLAFLIVGFFVTVSSGGQIAEMATGYGRQAFGKLAAAGTGFAAGAYTGAKTQATLKKDESFAKRAAYTLGGGMWGGVKTGVTEALTAKVEDKGKVASLGGLTGMIKSPLEREEIKQWTTRSKEVLTLEKPGTAEGMKQKQFESIKGPMGKLDNDKLREIAKDPAFTPEGNIKKYQAYQILMERKNLKDEEIGFLTENIKLASGYGFNKKEFAKFVPEEAEKLTDKKQTTTDVMSKMSSKEKQEKIRPVSLSNLFVGANLTAKDREYFDKAGTQQQRDAMEDPSNFNDFDFENHIANLNQRQIENLFRSLTDEQKNVMRNNMNWINQANAKIQEWDNLISRLPANDPQAISTRNIKNQTIRKLDTITNSIN
jgi:hypothetical protein